MQTATHLREVSQPVVATLSHHRFDRALGTLQGIDPQARVILDTETGLATGIDAFVPIAMPPAARALPTSDRSAAAAVLFLDRYGAMVGVAGWHVLTPVNVSPIGEALWFAFLADGQDGESFRVHVCAEGDVVRHVRVER